MTTNHDLSEMTLAVYQFVRRWIVKREYSPSYDEIAAGMGISKTNAHRHVNILSDLGYFITKRYQWRAIWLTERVPENIEHMV